MNKTEIRKFIKLKRQDLSTADVDRVSKHILERLFLYLEPLEISSLHTYLPIPSLKEINTWPMLPYAWHNRPNITTAVAPAHKGGKNMAIKVGPATKWRGLYPASRIEMPAGYQYDLIIVPTLAFDKNGYRLGWGGGWYDRFLASQPRALKIGLAYQSSLIEKGLPVEPHDVRLDKIITEKEVYDY